MSKLGLVCLFGLALATTGCGSDKKEDPPAKNKCEVQAERAMTECSASVPMLGDVTMCSGQSLCIAECAESATCADIAAAASFSGPVFTCGLNCFLGGGDAGTDDPLCDAQTMRVMTECGLGADAGAAPIDVPCRGPVLCVAQCTRDASCADIQQASTDNTGPFAECTTNCISAGL